MTRTDSLFSSSALIIYLSSAHCDSLAKTRGLAARCVSIFQATVILLAR